MSYDDIAANVRVIREAFADRRYEPDGSLTPRSIAGSTLTIEEAAMIARDGTRVPIAFDTLCIHADMEDAVARLRVIREALADRRYEPDGSLTPRSIAGSTLTIEEAAVIARDGARVRIAFDTLCIHADMENAVGRLRAIREAFAERRYESDGSLTPRSRAGSTLTIEEAAVIARDGTRVPIAFDTLCIHGGMENAVERLRAIRGALV